MALDAADLKAIADLIGDATAKAVRPLTDRLDGFDRAKKDAPDVAALIATAMEAKKEEAKKEEGKTENTKGDPAVLAKLAAMESQLAASKQATTDAESARKSEKMLGALRTAIGKADVPANRIDHVIALIHNSQKRIGLDDNGNPTMRFDRSSAGGAYQDHLGLDEGLKEFLETDDGKSFLPATQVQGGEVHNKTRPMASGGKPNMKSIQSALLGAAFNR